MIQTETVNRQQILDSCINKKNIIDCSENYPSIKICEAYMYIDIISAILSFMLYTNDYFGQIIYLKIFIFLCETDISLQGGWERKMKIKGFNMFRLPGNQVKYIYAYIYAYIYIYIYIYVLQCDNNLSQREFLCVFVCQFFCTVALCSLSRL